MKIYLKPQTVIVVLSGENALLASSPASSKPAPTAHQEESLSGSTQFSSSMSEGGELWETLD